MVIGTAAALLAALALLAGCGGIHVHPRAAHAHPAGADPQRRLLPAQAAGHPYCLGTNVHRNPHAHCHPRAEPDPHTQRFTLRHARYAP